jgi:hypothetical protein
MPFQYLGIPMAPRKIANSDWRVSKTGSKRNSLAGRERSVGGGSVSAY